MKQICLLVLGLMFPFLSFSQGAYFATDKSLTTGVKIMDMGEILNSQVCRVKENDNIIDYSPYQITEFGLKDGQVYVSREIQLKDTLKRVFLQRLVFGETSLYYLRGKGIKTFFIEKDSSLFVELRKNNKTPDEYREQLLMLTKDCPNVKYACKLVRYSKTSLSRLYEMYNQCELKPFPHFKFGFVTGYEFSRTVLSGLNELNRFPLRYHGGYMLGLYTDFPVLASDFSFRSEFCFARQNYSMNLTSSNEDLDVLIEKSTIKVPLLLRYTVPKNHFRPFFNAGTQLSQNIRNENGLYKTSVSQNHIEITKLNEKSMVSATQFGYVAGCGLEYDLDFRKAVFLEIRYSRETDIYKKIYDANSVLSIRTGISF